MSVLLRVIGYLPAAVARALVELVLAYHLINAMAKAGRLKA